MPKTSAVAAPLAAVVEPKRGGPALSRRGVVLKRGVHDERGDV